MQFGLSPALFRIAYDHFTAGRMAEAEHAVLQALQADPNHVDSIHLLGVLFGYAGNPQRSLELMDQAIALRPDFSSAHANRGVALLALARPGEATASFKRSVELDPRNVHGWHGLGNALGAQGDLAGAEAAFRSALEVNPGYQDARNSLGHTLQLQRRYDEAVEAFKAALSQSPNSPTIAYHLGVTLQLSGNVREALSHYRRALELQPDHVRAHNNILLSLNYIPEVSAEALLEEHRAFEAQHARSVFTPPGWPNDRDPERRLRIGYVSGDFHLHPVGHYLVGPLEEHDRAGFEVFCYATNPKEDEVTVRIAHAIDHWRDISAHSDDQAAALIWRDQIDILVDLSGHTDHNRLLLFARKPAPVQVSWLGYPGTTGLKAIDYLIMDACTLPPGADGSVEAVVRLPHGRFCYSAPLYTPDPSHPSAAPDRAVTFGSFNFTGKIGPDVIRLWARVLDAVPGSRLLLKSMELDQPKIRKQLAEAFDAAGVGSDRLDLRQGSSHFVMFGEYADIDIALDPFPFGGGLTSSEALWMGVPVVTLPQDRVASRQTLAFLHGLGLDDLAAASEDDYVRIAAALAADPGRRAELRQTLRPRMAASPMNDPKVFAQGLDAAYRQMWRRWCAGEAPEDITIA